LAGKPLVSPDNVLALLQNRDKNTVKVTTEDAVKDRKGIKASVEIEQLTNKKNVKDNQNEYVADRIQSKKHASLKLEISRAANAAPDINISKSKPAPDLEPIKIQIPRREAAPKEVESAPPPVVAKLAVNSGEKHIPENKNDPLAPTDIKIPRSTPETNEAPVKLKAPFAEIAAKDIKPASNFKPDTKENENNFIAPPDFKIAKNEPTENKEPLNLKIAPKEAPAKEEDTKSNPAPDAVVVENSEEKATPEQAAAKQGKPASKSTAEEIVVGNAVETENKENQNQYVSDRKSFKHDTSLGGENARPEAAAPDIKIAAATPAAGDDTNKLKIAREEEASKKIKATSGPEIETIANKTPAKKETNEKKELNLSIPSKPQGQSTEASSEGGENSEAGVEGSQAGGENSQSGGVLGEGSEFKLDSFTI
jgi:hypothetical protein